MNNTNLNTLLHLNKAHTALTKRFDRGMGNGIGFNEFLILFYIHQADNTQLRRIDLAEKIGITASGITRLLLPMEKIGLIQTVANQGDDARVRMVKITKGGKEKMNEAQEQLDLFLAEVFKCIDDKNKELLSDMLIQIGGKALML
ncbi:MarR family transcriptional regulator [Patescibacteria group bacterium]|nr:MarR family transcriptional regulator [Patescibacteria group bacterium]MBU1721659.1 MarR family transcriptional regulator [Patescibacteria group bacterium]MBU1900968.1 MarR family transcriptional regulator [Patescibacteria group bacterium]